ncbi:hypothetical protein [Pseudoflavonifractor sp. An85]|uniref:hypothetical protein n=1 Tax=Pseudoflavonifractor sp. An85 TaxID=1965661 RepID=UPI000B3A1D48|nr:hypothetical protein [Pseudoflavonifractor sp. An85]OUN26040.1 hypothetical protein B5G37_02085 [Pseudoflavonifractor sp. An85]
MKMRWVLLSVTALTIAAAVYGGAVIRPTFTDYTSQENWKEHFMVAGVDGSFGVDNCGVMKEYLPQSPYILRVEVLGDLEVLFGQAQQKVKVKQVYAGDGLEVGREIYLSRRGWSVVFVEPYSIERQYVNIMDVGREYLVFANGEIDALDSDLPVYSCCKGFEKETGETVSFLVAPVFCYDHTDNVPLQATGNYGTYVPYSEAKDNEFFGMTSEMVEAWEQLKAEMIQKYPR